jgi:hypothetical protein
MKLIANWMNSTDLPCFAQLEKFVNTAVLYSEKLKIWLNHKAKLLLLSS